MAAVLCVVWLVPKWPLLYEKQQERVVLNRLTWGSIYSSHVLLL